MAAKKEKDTSTSPLLAAAVRKAPSDDAAAERWPTLVSLLMPVWIDGKCKRQSGFFRLRLTGGYYVMTLSCPTEGLETSIMAESLVDLFDVMEVKLRDPACPWTPDWEATKKTRQVRIDRVKSD